MRGGLCLTGVRGGLCLTGTRGELSGGSWCVLTVEAKRWRVHPHQFLIVIVSVSVGKCTGYVLLSHG